MSQNCFDYDALKSPKVLASLSICVSLLLHLQPASAKDLESSKSRTNSASENSIETVELDKCNKVTDRIDLTVSVPRTFTPKSKILCASVGDASIAEVTVTPENKLILLGKTDGTTPLTVIDETLGSISIDLKVTRRDYKKLEATPR